VRCEVVVKVVILQHTDTDGPGTLGEYLLSVGTDVHTIKLYESENPPGEDTAMDAVISLGGPMHAWEDTEYPFLPQETRFLSHIIERKIPILGICLGAQLIARACGSHVHPADTQEIGWRSVSLTENGSKDPLFAGIHNELTVFQYHEDTFELPAEGRLLGSSSACRNQIFRLGNAYGVQFHPEVHRGILEEWFSKREDREEVLNGYERVKEVFFDQNRKFYENFLSIIREWKRTTSV
jgi:GMP synthase-like glutamine amidotransferase